MNHCICLGISIVRELTSLIVVANPLASLLALLGEWEAAEVFDDDGGA